MACEYIGICGGCTGEDLESKIQNVSQMLQLKKFQVFKSSTSGFRARAELAVLHENGAINFAMRSIKDKNQKSSLICIENCLNLTLSIQKALPILRNILNSADFLTFKERLFSLEILASFNSLLITLIYHRKIDESWAKTARILREKLQESLGEVQLIGRAKGVKIVIEQDFLIESLNVLDKTYFYRYDEGAFTQPNPAINTKMIEWILQNLGDCKDLLEMYCGCGNFTIPLAQKFRKILATEVSKTSIKSAQFAAQINKVDNINFVRLSGLECIEALKKVRAFNRLKAINLESFDFDCVLIDPPRSGLGAEICEFLLSFKRIIYISCNPVSLKNDLEILNKTHKITKAAFFDQFPNTHHLEVGLILENAK